MSLQRFVAKRRDLRDAPEVKIGEPTLLATDEQGRLLVNGGARKSASSDIALNSADPDGILTSVATSTVETTFRPEDYDGAVVVSGQLDTPRNVTITLGANVGSYSTDPIKVSGLDAQGETVVEQLTPSSADGGETLETATLFLGAVTVVVPAQQDGSGTIEIGVGIAVSIDPPCDALFVATAGSMVVELVDDFGHTMTLGTPENFRTLPYAVKSIHSIDTADGIRPVYY